MIVSKLTGGLGNQLFQYAAGRRLAHARGTQLALDTHAFQGHTPRRYALGPFQTIENFASPEEVAALTAAQRGLGRRIMTRLLWRPPLLAPTHIREKERFQFSPRILDLPDGVYLEGSWQHERYFADVADIIRREFSLRTAPDGENRKLITRIAECNSVGLHVRRGDYASDPDTNRFHGTCSPDYYAECAELIGRAVPCPHIFVFSDEPAWARENLRLPHPTTIVSHNRPDTDYQDLRLMAACKHQIIANSTFSWWAAWLNENPEKRVFAPRQWLLSETCNAEGIIPTRWLKV